MNNSNKFSQTAKLLLLIFAATALVMMPGTAAFCEEQQPKERMHQLHVPAKRAADADYEYIDTTYENLSKAYWAIGKMNINEPADIDNYLMINECALYRKYRSDDFEWEKIRKSAKDMIQDSMASFPTRFELIIPVSLGVYDAEEKYFPLSDESRLINKKRIGYAGRYIFKTCDHGGTASGYPSNLILLFSHPFTIEKIPMVPELAELYIAQTRKSYEKLPANMQLVQYQRLAYLRLKVRLVQYKETTIPFSNDLRANIFANLEGYEVYADDDMQLLLYKENYGTGRRPPRLKKYSNNQGNSSVTDVPPVTEGEAAKIPQE